MNPKVKPGDRIRVIAWGQEAVKDKYVGLEGAVRSVSRDGIVIVDLDNDPLATHHAIHRMGLAFDPAFRADKFEKVSDGMA